MCRSSHITVLCIFEFQSIVRFLNQLHFENFKLFLNKPRLEI